MVRELFLPVSAQSSVQDQVDYAIRADELGYDRIWLPETWGRDAISILATIAARTDDIGIGTSISSVYSRSPTLLGQTAATLQELSNGRFRLGVGPSAPPVNELWHGVAHEQPLKRLREAIEIIKLALSGDIVDYDGDIFDLSGFRLRFDPPTPAPRVDAAALGPKAMELAGRFADGVHTTMMTRDGLAESMTHFDRGVELGDRGRDELRVMVGIPCCVLQDRDRALRRVRHHLAFYIGAMGNAYQRQLARQGYENEADEITRLWMQDRKDDAESIITEILVDELAIAGALQEAQKSLATWEEHDSIDSVAAVLPVHTSVDENIATIEALAPQST